MDRMPAIDRNILRIALFEILWLSNLDDEIAVSEAVEIATELSTDDSAKYINGVLGRIVILKPSGAI
jgi:N utilization substance protein B